MDTTYGSVSQLHDCSLMQHLALNRHIYRMCIICEQWVLNLWMIISSRVDLNPLVLIMHERYAAFAIIFQAPEFEVKEFVLSAAGIENSNSCNS